MRNQRKRVLTFVGLGLAIGIGFGLYAVFRWMIPTGLVVFLIVVLAIQGALIPLWVRYVRAVRARLRPTQ